MKKIKGTELRFERVKTVEDFNRMRTFVESFDHSINDVDVKAPLFFVKRGEEVIGTFQLCNSPILFTAWNPNVATHRDVVEGMKAFTGWARLEAALYDRLPAFTTVSLDTKTFLPGVMEKMGMKRMGMELYTIED